MNNLAAMQRARLASNAEQELQAPPV
ncbi:MAG: hypothetical protein JWN47_2315, partial [Frankiales bacterium]|nr:hypothetical protein [Frankiales bacterium]